MRRMHDPKFEKEVQQKLQELSFGPSEAVWTNIERAVGGEKKRRVPVSWIFLLSALTMTGTGLVYFSTRTGMAHREIAKHATASPAPAVRMGPAATSLAGGPESIEARPRTRTTPTAIQRTRRAVTRRIEESLLPSWISFLTLGFLTVCLPAGRRSAARLIACREAEVAPWSPGDYKGACAPRRVGEETTEVW